MPPVCVDYYPSWVADADGLLKVLRDEIAWEQHAVTLYGRTTPTPRLTAWIGDSAYRYSGIVNQPVPWPVTLAEVRDRLRRELGVDFNSCLANLYRDGTDSMGYHSDNEPELGHRPTIASVSLGDRRWFVLRHRRTGARWSWDLGHGDLLVMRDESQSDYAHAVPKTSRAVGPRMNLTFRFFGPPSWKPHPSCEVLTRFTPESGVASSSGVRFPGNFASAVNIRALFEAFTKCEGSSA